ncbi:GntR family transcriptional regulator [Rhizorhabdus dicambivorans]|uniref:GntR family transcriptional regulator n=1 Tax=Rhizorhabdus dicambivorans TaxID=1850238 RepID=UPI001596B002|nr:GntR family transcriptional regulator [Rhizorhabdus dicambivorans]
MSNRETGRVMKRGDTPARATIADTVTDELRQLIISGELSDGVPLRQDALAERLGVSRIPVREALSRLEREGLAASYPHRGYVVTALSRAEIEELFDLRAQLEPELLRVAIPAMTEGDLRTAEAVLDEYNREIDAADIGMWGEFNLRYHMALYAPSGRKRTLEIIRGLLVNTDRYTRLVLTLGTGVEQAKDDHGGLLDLCRKRSVNQAVALTRDHIQRARLDLLELLDSQQDGDGLPAMKTA